MLMYSKPDSAAEVSGAGSRTGRRAMQLPTAACFGISVLVFVLAFISAGLGLPDGLAVFLGLAGSVLFCLSILVALCRAGLGVLYLIRPQAPEAEPMGRALSQVIGNLCMAGFGMFLAYLATMGFSRGRQLRRFGRVLLPRLRADAAWAAVVVPLESADSVPAGLADQWRENGKTEHASVAAFARLTLDLMALGAPPALVVAANRDSLDEIRHAELCFSLARSIDGKSLSPAPFPEPQRVGALSRSRTLALSQLAVDSLVDGALHEGVSARVIARLARRCRVPAIASVLKKLAADEGRHAAHGWAVVEWCLRENADAVGSALAGAVRALPREMRSELPTPAVDGGWEPWGIHGHALESEEYAAALAHVRRRVAGMTQARPTSSPLIFEGAATTLEA